VNSLLLEAMKTACPEFDPITLPFGFESFWEYDVLPNSPAANAAPEFEKIRRKAIAILSAPTAEAGEIGDSGAAVEAGVAGTARNTVAVS
jgi:hypothetical protein